MMKSTDDGQIFTSIDGFSSLSDVTGTLTSKAGHRDSGMAWTLDVMDPGVDGMIVIPTQYPSTYGKDHGVACQVQKHTQDAGEVTIIPLTSLLAGPFCLQLHHSIFLNFLPKWYDHFHLLLIMCLSWIAASIYLDPLGQILQNSGLWIPYIRPLTAHNFFAVWHLSCECWSSLPPDPFRALCPPFLAPYTLGSLRTSDTTSCIWYIMKRCICFPF
jgi:hypothetical protein